MSIKNENIDVVGDHLLKDWQIVGCKKRDVEPLIPVGKSTWWAGVADGRFPKPVRIGRSNAAFWRASDIRALIDSAEERA